MKSKLPVLLAAMVSLLGVPAYAQHLHPAKE
jgi:hypothetical protein